MSSLFNIEDYNSPLPELIYPDADFLYQVYGDNANNQYADECYNFTNRLAANSCIMAISSLALEELDHVILKGIYQKYGNQRRPQVGWLKLFKQTKEYIPEVVAEIERVSTLLRENANVVELSVTIDEFFTNLRRGVMLSSRLDVRDASLIVAAWQNGINALATVDIDYQNVPDFNIFTPNPRYFVGHALTNTLIPLPGKLF